jgi:hypothetical protein
VLSNLVIALSVLEAGQVTSHHQLELAITSISFIRVHNTSHTSFNVKLSLSSVLSVFISIVYQFNGTECISISVASFTQLSVTVTALPIKFILGLCVKLTQSS